MKEASATGSHVNTSDESFLRQVFQGSLDNKDASRNESINLTAEEVQQFEKAFANKEFRNLMAEYVSEISDPKHRAEQDAYIRQLESQQNVPEGKQIVRPTPGIVLKFKHIKKKKHFLQNNTNSNNTPTESKTKLFINIVSSPKIDKPTAKTVNHGSESKKKQWSVPYSMGPIRMESDKSKSLVPTFDCCFHPDALINCAHLPGFQDLLAQSAREGATKQFSIADEKVEIDPTYHILKGISYKNGKPPVMLISDQAFVNRENSSPKKEKIQKSKESQNVDKNEHGDFTKGFLQTKKNKIPNKKMQHNADGCREITLTPKYTLAERKAFDIVDNTIQNTNHDPCRPSFLVYRIELPQVSHISDIDLDISSERLLLKSISKDDTSMETRYLLDLKLRYQVDCDDVKAKWEKDKHQLNVTIPVKSPKVESHQTERKENKGLPTSVTESWNELDDSNVTKANQRYEDSKITQIKRDVKPGDHSRWVHNCSSIQS